MNITPPADSNDVGIPNGDAGSIWYGIVYGIDFLRLGADNVIIMGMSVYFWYDQVIRGMARASAR